MIRKLSILFVEMFKIALFVVGGGYAIIAVVDDVFSRKLKWLKEGEVVEQLPLFQMIPGILAGHAAVYVGRRVAGWQGSVVALVAVALPSILIFTAVSMGYEAIPLESPWLGAVFAGLRAALTGVIFAMIVRGWRKGIVGWQGYLAFGAATVALLAGVNVLLVIVVAIVCALVRGARTQVQSSPLAALLFLQYGLVALGGGYVLVPLYLQDFVGNSAPFLQIAEEEFANLMALTQMTPGPIGINAATFFGYRLWGLGGAFVSSLCLLLPGFVILSCALASLERFRENRYLQAVLTGMKPITLAMMFVAFLSFAKMSCDPRGICLSVGVVAAMLYTHLGVVKLIFLSAGTSLVIEYLLYLYK